MKKYILGAVFSIGLLVSPAFTQAAGLTTTQVNAIISLLSSFGADQSVINRVSITLNHGSTTTTTSTVPGCAAGAVFSSTTGNDCGCPIGQVFSSMTGNACGTWTTPTVQTITVLSPNGGEVLTENSKVVDSLSSVDSQKQIFEIKWSGAPDSFTDIFGDNAGNVSRIAAFLEEDTNIPGMFNTVGRIIPAAYGSIMWIVGQVSNGECLWTNNNSTLPLNHCENSRRNVSPGKYYIRILDTTTGAVGRSNAFTIVSAGTTTTTTSSAPTVTFVGTPTLRLQYDSTQHESALVADAAYMITAGDSDVTFDSYKGTSKPYVLSSNMNAGTWTITGPSVIKAGQTASYTATLKANPKIMFAGQYYLQTNNLGYSVNGQWYNLPSTSFIKANPLPTVTIVGEVSPYISSITSDLDGNGIIKGVRLTGSINYNGVTKLYPVTNSSDGGYIYFKPSDFGVTGSLTAQVQIINPSVGNSNIVWFNYTAPTSTHLTSTQIQSVQSILSSFGASNAAIVNVNTILYGGIVPASNLAPSNLSSAQVSGILSLLSSFGADSTMIANVKAVLSVTTTTSTPTISVLSPNGGETYQSGQNMTIRWNASNFPLNTGVYIELRPTGYPYTPVTKIQFLLVWQLGSYNWTIPAGTTPGQYIVEIYETDNYGTVIPTGVKDISDAPFTVTAPTVTTPAPTVTSSFSPFSISPTGSTVYRYDSNNTTHCVTTHPDGTGGWDNVTPNASFSGTYTASQLPNGLTTTQTCYNAAGQSAVSTAQLIVQAASVPAPTVTSSFSPSTISPTGSTVYSYSSNNTTHCVTSHPDQTGGWDNIITNASFSGTYTASQLPNGLTTTQTCYNSAGQSAVSTATVTVTNQGASAYDAFSSAMNSETSSPQGTGNTTTFHYVWNNNLQIGSSNTEDVKALQTALTHEGLYTEEISGGFYNQTYLAVKAFQQKYGIDTGTSGAGFVGLKTRAKLNSLY